MQAKFAVPSLLRRPFLPAAPMKYVATQASLAASASTLSNAQYIKELDAACDAVRLASSLCQAMQTQLADGEKQDKPDSSPVTVADYGAQAVVAWSLSRSFPGSKISMVAEEDSGDLRAPEGQTMLARIQSLVNSYVVQADSAASVSASDVIDLIDLGGSPGGAEGRHWVLDPIDGTRGFVGMRQYSICLGLIQDGKSSNTEALCGSEVGAWASKVRLHRFVVQNSFFDWLSITNRW